MRILSSHPCSMRRRGNNYNETAINGLFASNRAARTILKELASMPRQDETLIEAIEKKLSKTHDEITRRDIVSLFKLLDEYGAGEFVPGRRGHPSRFRWEVDSVNLTTADIAFPQRDEIPAPAPAPISSPTVLIVHRYQLRPDMMIALQLPSDLTPTEAHRLSQFINSLPFDVDQNGGTFNRVAGAQ